MVVLGSVQLPKIEVSQYGKSGAKTLKEFSEELIKGDVHIVKDKCFGSILVMQGDLADALLLGMVGMWSPRRMGCT